MSSVSPLHSEMFAQELSRHPDQVQVSYVLEGLRSGFKLGFENRSSLKSAKKNKLTAFKHPKAIDDYLLNETRLGRVAGPFTISPLRHLHISSFGIIPQKGQPGKWRLIVDLSSPGGYSVNAAIDSEQCSMQYVRVDDIIRMVIRYGQGALMAKFDVEAAYRNIPIHPSDRHLLGMKWRNQFYVDLALPFGLRSAPYIFNSVADMVEWILLNNYNIPALVHYLDDFITVGPPDSPICHQSLATALAVCKRLGLPLHPKKCEGPASALTILGIHLNSQDQTAQLPDEKLAALRLLLNQWSGRRTCTRNQLESLIGHLHHAAKVVWPGRAFIRRMIDLLSCFRSRNHPIRLNREFHLDLEWWTTFLSHWHGVSFWLFPGLTASPDVEVFSDASGSIGFGAFCGSEWFNGRWSACQEDLSIAYKELFPVVVIAAVFGHRWCKQHILFRSDNEAVVAILNSRTSKVPAIMHLLRHLLFSAARCQFSFSSAHIPGIENSIADALSRFRWQEFRRLAPDAFSFPLQIPGDLLKELTVPLWSLNA